MDQIKISSAGLAYRLFGPAGKPLVVVESMLGGSSAEWWHLAESWAADFQILTYDRAGYGGSSCSSRPRSPAAIAGELNELRDCLDLTQPAILIGHSMGGLYVQQYARLYPQRVKGLVLLDPVSARNYTFRERMSRQEFARTGFDKTAAFKTGKTLTGFGLGFLIKPLLKQSPSFYYFQGLSREAEAAVLRNLTRADMYKTALAEYAFIDGARQLPGLEGAEGFPAIPLVLVCHCPAVMAAEIGKFGGADPATAARLDGMWIEVMKEYLSFSRTSAYLQSSKSSHHLHLGDPELVREALYSLI